MMLQKCQRCGEFTCVANAPNIKLNATGWSGLVNYQIVELVLNLGRPCSDFECINSRQTDRQLVELRGRLIWPFKLQLRQEAIVMAAAAAPWSINCTLIVSISGRRFVLCHPARPPTWPPISRFNKTK